MMTVRPLPAHPHRARRILAAAALAWLSAPAMAAPGSVPDPLRLGQALAFAADHPRVQAAEGAGNGARAPLAPPRAQPLYLGCHSLAFAGARPGDAARDVAWSGLIPAPAAQRLEIMQRFFDVLLADLSFARDNEAMAVAYVRFDRATAREELGQFSSLRTAELEAEYQRIRRQRAASEAAQRITRSLLAQALGRPGELPRQVVTPERGEPGEAPALEQVVARARFGNARIKALRNGRSEAGRALIDMAVRERALELLTRLELLDVIAEQARAESEWRELKLDESRTLYELEAKADLGFSMSQQTKARRDQEQVELCRRLTAAELAALQGAASGEPVP